MRITTALRFLAALGLVISLAFTGCVRREGRNCDCIWPEVNARPLDPSRGGDARHLREDVELAEDLAVRYMDAQRRSQSTQLRPGGPPGEVMNTCRNSLLKQISTSHNVSPREVVQFFGLRSLASISRSSSCFFCSMPWRQCYWLAGPSPLSARREHDRSPRHVAFVLLGIRCRGTAVG